MFLLTSLRTLHPFKQRHWHPSDGHTCPCCVIKTVQLHSLEAFIEIMCGLLEPSPNKDHGSVMVEAYRFVEMVFEPDLVYDNRNTAR